MKCSTRVGILEFVRKKLGKKVVYETIFVSEQEKVNGRKLGVNQEMVHWKN